MIMRLFGRVRTKQHSRPTHHPLMYRAPRTERRGRCRLVAVIVAVLLSVQVVGFSAPGSAEPPPKFNPPKQYYLSLGDSLGFGLQLARFFEMLNAGTYTPDAFHTGYTDVFASLMRRIRPDLQVVNYSCPGGGGDTTQFMTDGCFFTDIGLDLQNNFTGAQLDAAVTFLKDHRGQVSPVTLSTGGDDIDAAIVACNADPTCVADSGLAQRLSRDLGEILSTLRTAAPDTELIMYLPHNIDEVAFPGSNAVWATYVAEMRAIAAAHQVAVVDGFQAITVAGRTCELTFMCTADVDPHLTDAGYALIGQLFFDASGYQRLLH